VKGGQNSIGKGFAFYVFPVVLPGKLNRGGQNE
jgi:hypothetical protein